MTVVLPKNKYRSMPVMTFYTRRMPVMTFYIPGVCQYDLSYTRSMPALVYVWHMQMPFQFFLAKFGWSNLAYVGHTAQYKISRIPLCISLPGICLAYTPKNLHDWAQWLGNRDFLKMGDWLVYAWYMRQWPQWPSCYMPGIQIYQVYTHVYRL